MDMDMDRDVDVGMAMDVGWRISWRTLARTRARTHAIRGVRHIERAWQCAWHADARCALTTTSVPCHARVSLRPCTLPCTCRSPDGQFLCCPHAFKKPVHIAVVLRRPKSGNAWAQE